MRNFHNSPSLKLSGYFYNSESEMSTAASCKIIPGNNMVSLNSPVPPKILTRISFSLSCTSVFDKFPSSCYYSLSPFSSRRKTLAYSNSSEEAEVSEADDEWLQKLPDKKKPLYSHSLPCVEAWLRSLGFYQSKDDRAVWFVEKPDWHAHLSLDVTDLYIRYLKSGSGNLEKDVERRFSYALSREDIENAVLGGP